VVKFAPPPGKTSWPHVSKWTDAEWACWLDRQGWSAERVRGYLRDRVDYGVGVKDRKGRMTWLYQPTPRQVEAHKVAAVNLLYGGAAGGAKSHWLRWELYKRCLQVPGSRYLLFRRTYAELQDNHIDETRREVQRMIDLGVSVAYLSDEKRVVFNRGTARESWIRYAHCENEGDEEKYLSSQYEGVGLDELATFTQKQAMGILSRLRSGIEGATPMARCSSNPGGAETLWVKRWFIDHDVSEDDDPYYEVGDWAYVPSKLYDNPWLMDPDGSFRTYEKRLGPVGTERRRQLLDGDWDAIAGQFFSEWRPSVHVRDLGPLGEGIEWVRGLDWGYYPDPAVCLWIACLPDGRLYVRHEASWRETIAVDVAKGIFEQTRALAPTCGAVHVRYTSADPSMWNLKGQTGESIAETIQRAGVPLRSAKHERKSGWMRLRAFLAVRPDGTGGESPGVVIHPDCKGLIRTLPTLVYDADGDMKAGNDHWADALRYACMSRPTPSWMSTAKQEPGPGTAGELRREAMRSQRKVLGSKNTRRAA
jgi:phage terminase large subunit